MIWIKQAIQGGVVCAQAKLVTQVSFLRRPDVAHRLALVVARGGTQGAFARGNLRGTWYMQEIGHLVDQRTLETVDLVIGGGHLPQVLDHLLFLGGVVVLVDERGELVVVGRLPGLGFGQAQQDRRFFRCQFKA